jgi:hypothetical protein
MSAHFDAFRTAPVRATIIETMLALRSLLPDMSMAAALSASRQPRAVGRAHVDADIVSPHARRLTDLRQHGNHRLGVEH